MPEPIANRVYTRDDVRRLLALSERELSRWEGEQLVPAAQEYTFADLIALRTLVRLRQDKVPVSQIRNALDAVRQKLRNVTDPLRELRIVAEGRRVRVLLGRQTMEAISGQLLLDFSEAELSNLLSFPGAAKPAPDAREQQRQRHDAEHFFQLGVDLEQRSAPMAEVVEAYEKAASLDPASAAPLVNLGTVYFNARKWRDAERCYRRALEIHPDYPLAHFNLANLHDERGDRPKALSHYQRALDLHPHYADAHYNIALLYQGMGDVLKAVRHWQAFLKLDATSAWAAIARRELDKLRRQTVVEGAKRG